MVTVYGDDLYHVKYSQPNDKEKEKPARFRVDDYAYAHTLFHFTDGAVLEPRLKPWQPGGLDRLVLSGPNNGDGRFYVVDLAAANGSAWRSAAKTINKSGAGESALVGIRRTLDTLSSGIDSANVSSGSGGGGSAQLFLMLMDPGAISRQERRLALRQGGGAKEASSYEVFDQLGSQTAPLCTLAGSEQITVVIPAGSVRFLVMRTKGSI